ncbi:hypothetical protein SAY87_004586 [Trapa incisa]|uniref:BZIP domain-containing protein n=1 Tax=Trapa incisa TaxID=236973 RepID=A0AAN7JP55_9MYRT|nr:hypothetical protein SAY87_004586 [Trapa incisa]
MASPQRPASSGSGSDMGSGNVGMDERKRKRMESNRLSAQRSRMKKQKLMEDLIRQVAQLQKANVGLVESINATTQNYVDVESRNNFLRAQMMELTDRLGSLNSLLQMVEDASLLALDIPYPMIEQPWQAPFPSQPILANVHTFQC